MNPEEIKALNARISGDHKKAALEEGLPETLVYCPTHKKPMPESEMQRHGCPVYEIYELTGRTWGATPD